MSCLEKQHNVTAKNESPKIYNRTKKAGWLRKSLNSSVHWFPFYIYIHIFSISRMTQQGVISTSFKLETQHPICVIREDPPTLSSVQSSHPPLIIINQFVFVIWCIHFPFSANRSSHRSQPPHTWCWNRIIGLPTNRSHPNHIGDPPAPPSTQPDLDSNPFLSIDQSKPFFRSQHSINAEWILTGLNRKRISIGIESKRWSRVTGLKSLKKNPKWRFNHYFVKTHSKMHDQWGCFFRSRMSSRLVPLSPVHLKTKLMSFYHELLIHRHRWWNSIKCLMRMTTHTEVICRNGTS